MIDIEKMAKENGFVTHLADDGECYADYDTLKDFAEAYHKAMCERSEPVGYIPKTYELNILANSNDEPLGMVYPTKRDSDDVALYTTPQPLKRLSEDEVLKLLNVKNDSPNVLVYLGISNAIMDEMERINK